MTGLPEIDQCDQEDPLAFAILGLLSVTDALVRDLADPQPQSRPPAAAHEHPDELAYAVLGVISVHRSLRRLLAGLVEPEPLDATVDASDSTALSRPPPRPGELLW